jgi:hypothetical protein
MPQTFCRLLALSLLLLAPLSHAAMDHAGHGASSDNQPSPCNDPEAPAALECALAPTAAFDSNGRLWVVWALGGHVYLSHSDDKGVSFGSPLPVNRLPERIAADGENRPKVIPGMDGQLYVSWTMRLPKPYSGDVRFAYSKDGGKNFSAPVTINDNRDITSHRFESMGVNERGELFLAWLDKRDQLAQSRSGKKYAGAALYYTVSTDGGASFRANRKLADHTCECCRTAMAFDRQGNPVIVWRHVFAENIRDHAITRLSGQEPGSVRRLSFDQWKIDACPHHGPAIDIAGDGRYHTVWFNNAPERHGLFYAFSEDHGDTFSEPFNFGRYDAGAAHPDVLALGDLVYLTWKEFDGKQTAALVMRSRDRGKSWSKPAVAAVTTGDSDHPFLISDGRAVYLSWHRRGLPYQAIPVSGAVR